MAKAWPIAGLQRDTRFGDAAAAAVELRTREVFEHAEGVLDTRDVERVHDMRVATRRLRAALELFDACFPPKRHKRLLAEVKALGEALGARRDPDVAIERLEAVRRGFHTTDRTGVDSLLAELRDEQAAGNERLAPALAHARESELERRLLELAEGARA
jgi:CHAD domain-containing protein